jgi:polysaccharide deacetylase 2 family uncharacterized protein YibQ
MPQLMSGTVRKLHSTRKHLLDPNSNLKLAERLAIALDTMADVEATLRSVLPIEEKVTKGYAMMVHGAQTRNNKTHQAGLSMGIELQSDGFLDWTRHKL